jgi:hypothetical protein
VTAVVVDPSGQAAWSAHVGSRGITHDHVSAIRRGGPLADVVADGVEPASLRIAGHAATWLAAGERRALPIPPVAPTHDRPT